MIVAGIGGLALVPVGFGAAHAELYFPLDPAIDTVFAPGYTEEQFDVVTTGMTKAEVVRLVGQPLDTFRVTQAWHPFLKVGAVEGWAFSHDGACKWGDFAWLGRYVYFNDQGKVTETARVVHHD
jgi:hypothetical protein